jgi:hypothetical protein
MNEKKIRFLLLFGLTMFLCAGSVFLNPNLNMNNLDDNQGDTPTDVDSPDTSAQTLLSGTGSNIGIYQYAIGRKEGTYFNTKSNWQTDGTSGYVRTVGDISMPVPDGAWTVKSLSASVDQLRDYHQFIADPTLGGPVWGVLNGTNAAPLDDPVDNEHPDAMVQNGRQVQLTMSGNPYFASQQGVAFDVGTDRKTYSSGISSGWGSPQVSGTNEVTRAQSSSHWYIRSDQGGNFDLATASPADSNFGYRDGYETGIQSWDDAYFSQNGGAQPSDMTGYEEHTPNFPIPSGGVIDAWCKLWTYGSAGSRTPATTLTTYTQTAFVSVSWNDYIKMGYYIDKEIPWTDDGSNPQSATVSYTLTRLSFGSENTYEWFDTPSAKQTTASHQENKKAEVTVSLVDPDGGTSTVGFYKFADGPAYASDSSYIKDDSARVFSSVPITLTTKASTNPWKLRFQVNVEVQNYGLFSSISSDAVGGSLGVYAWMCLESRVKSKFGVQIKDVTSTVQDELPWDTGKDENYVCVQSQEINFGNRTVYNNIDPYFEFDWIVPSGIVGPQCPINNQTGLNFAQPFVLIESHTLNAQNVDIVARKMITDSENFQTVRTRVRPTQYPWLGPARSWGTDHFNATASGLASILNYANEIVIYIGFKFTKEFITDWKVGTTASGGLGNNSLCITNASFAFYTNPLPENIDMQLIWDRVGFSIREYNIKNTALGSGTLYTTDSTLAEYTESVDGRQFYFRVNDLSPMCYFEWSITLEIHSVSWGTSTTYKITSEGVARYESNFTLTVPTKTGFITDYKDTWWFDIIFPRYQMVTNGEPYWDLLFAYETAHASTLKWGLENLAEALIDKEGKIAVFENDTDSNRYRLDTPLTGILDAAATFPYHQFGRFHHQLLQSWVGAASIGMNVLFTAPNYVSAIQLDKHSDFKSTDTMFYSNERCYVNGTYAVTMNQPLPFDIGGAMIRWLSPSNTIIDSLFIPSSRVLGRAFNTSVESGKHLMTIETPDGGYSAQFIYNDSNVCGEGYGVAGEYCSGIFRLGYKYALFSSQHGSLVNPQQGIYVRSTSIAKDGVPTIDTLLTHKPFEIVITWLDSVTLTPITGADVRIVVDKWERESTQVKRSIAVTEFNNVNMKEMGNGSYIIYVDPEYKGHLTSPYGHANMTQGFHNFTVTLNKGGYDAKVIHSNFSIIVDTILILTSPRHTILETNGYTTPARPHFDDDNAFAGREYSFVAKLYENLSDTYDQNNVFVDDEGSFYYTMYNVTYQLAYWNDKDDKFPLNPWTDGQAVNLTWVYTVPNDIVNGSFQASSGGSEQVGAVHWPKFGDINLGGGVYEAPKYAQGIHIYYNVTFKIETNRTKYTRNYFWQPNDVRVQTCEDNPADSGVVPDAQKYSTEEIFGINLHAENTGNVTFLSLINDPILDGKAFNMGIYQPDIEHYGLITETYEINNFWYNATAPRFRFRAVLNCTNGAGSGLDSSKSPPAGPLNYTNELYHETYDWFGNTEIRITGWNSSIINMTQDTTYPMWSCMVNTTQPAPGGFLAWGYTYVSPWLYYNETDAGAKYITIRSSKKGFIDDGLTVLLTTWNQNTTIFNNSDPSKYFSKETSHKAKITTPTGVTTSLIIQFNDTTPGNPMFGVENATIACVDDDWVGHFSSNEGRTWYSTALGKGRYKITLNDTNLNVLAPTVKTAEFELTKGNYTLAAFALDITITPRQMKIIYLGGKDLGYYLPLYVDGNWTQLQHIKLTYAILDLSNASASIDFSSGIYLNYFSFKQPDLTPYTTSIVKGWNGTAWNYNVTIKTNIPMDFNIYSKSLIVNFSIFGVTNYYPAHVTKGITINAINTLVQMRVPASGPQTVRYLWNSSTEWLTGCPTYEFNVTDIVHNSFLKRNVPITLGDIILTSTWSNPNRNGSDAINFGTDNEDIFFRTRTAIDGYGVSYQYLQIIVDHRGIDVDYIGKSFTVTIKIKNYLDATVALNLIIINATTSIENDRLEYAIYDSDQVPYNQEITFGKIYSNSSAPPYNVLTIPWGMMLAVKCGYKSGNLIIKSDTDLVSMAIEGLVDGLLFPASVNPSVYEQGGTGQFFFWFKTTLRTEETVNRLFKIILSKANFNPAEYTINYTVRPRITGIQNETSYILNTPWTDFATFSFKYYDSDILDEGIASAVINSTKEQLNGPVFDFGDGLTASWKFTYYSSGSGRYQIRINTSALEVRETPFVFNFNVTKLGDDLLVHWAPQLFTLNVFVSPIQIQIDHWFIKGESEPIGAKSAVNEPFGFATYINPENFAVLSIYLKVYTIINGEPVYVTDNSEISIFVTIYDWNDELGLINASNKLTYKVFEYDIDEEYWVARIEFDFMNGLDLIALGFPAEVKLYGSTGIVINATSANPNFKATSSKWVAGIEGGEVIIPWWFWLMVGAVAVTGGSMGLYGIRKALQLRIPFVLRMIDESIDKIEKDKFPSVGVMMGRSEYVINLVIEYLDLCGIEWETTEKYEVESTKSEESDSNQPPMSLNELTAELSKMENLTPDERLLFIDELKQLDRKAQVEFLKSLREENKA